MANIAINDIHPTGIELFMDSESFLLDLNHDEISNVNGGVLFTLALFAADVAISVVVYLTARD